MKSRAIISGLGLALVLFFASVVLAPREATSRAGVAPAPRALAVSTHIAAEGRVVAYPGAEIVVGTDFAGTIIRFTVKEKSTVRKGELLVELNADVERAALAQARARVAEAGADVKLAEFEKERAERLLASKVGTRQASEKAARDVDAARARNATAAADVERLLAQIAKSRIVAPISGVVLARHVEPGETVDRGARLLTIADLDRLRIEAEVDESDAGRVAIGAPATVKAEGDGGRAMAGRVEEIPDAVTARRLKPQDPGRPSDTRVLLVKVVLEGPAKPAALKLGRRVEVDIEGSRP